ncbi:hypothetical protein FB451DRAFT_1478686 [Mycena latifolia]|nr:hypothetical protein FB451DRAFT_1478686 [Mycena latifolia]
MTRGMRAAGAAVGSRNRSIHEAEALEHSVEHVGTVSRSGVARRCLHATLRVGAPTKSARRHTLHSCAPRHSTPPAPPPYLALTPRVTNTRAIHGTLRWSQLCRDNEVRCISVPLDAATLTGYGARSAAAVASSVADDLRRRTTHCGGGNTPPGTPAPPFSTSSTQRGTCSPSRSTRAHLRRRLCSPRTREPTSTPRTPSVPARSEYGAMRRTRGGTSASPWPGDAHTLHAHGRRLLDKYVGELGDDLVNVEVQGQVHRHHVTVASQTRRDNISKHAGRYLPGRIIENCARDE